MLYRRIDFDENLEDGFGEDVVFVGVHAVYWHDHPLHPSVAFVGADDPSEDVEAMITACEILMKGMLNLVEIGALATKDYDAETIKLVNDMHQTVTPIKKRWSGES